MKQRSQKIKGILSSIVILMMAVVLFSCKTATLESSTAQSLMVHDSLGVDSAIIRIAAPYKMKLDSAMNRVIGYSEFAMEKGTPESLLGNFLSDVMVSVVKNDFKDSISGLPVMSLLNNGGIRTSLPKGEVTVSNIFQLMPFDNEIVILELRGDILQKLFDVIAQKGGMPVGGLRLVLNATAWTKAEIGGKTFSADERYILVTSDYLAQGGDGLDFLADNIRYIKTGLLVRDVFIRYIEEMTKEGKTISPKLDERIRYE